MAETISDEDLFVTTVLSLVVSGGLGVAHKWQNSRLRDLEAFRHLQTFSDLKHVQSGRGKAFYQHLVAAEGTLCSEAPVRGKALHAPTPAMVVKLEQRNVSEEKDAAGVWHRRPALLPVVTKQFASDWCLQDADGLKVPILCPEKARSMPLQNEGSLLRHASSYTTRANDTERFVGIQEDERILPVGRRVTVYGELDTGGSSDAATNGRVAKYGHFLAIRPDRDHGLDIQWQSHQQLLQGARDTAAVFKWFAIAAGVVCVSAASCRLLRCWRRRKTRRRRRQHPSQGPAPDSNAGSEQTMQQHTSVPDMPAGTANGNQGLAGDDEARLCSICQSNEACVAFVQCGHECMCTDCEHLVVRCPICRAQGQRIRLYHT